MNKIFEEGKESDSSVYLEKSLSDYTKGESNHIDAIDGLHNNTLAKVLDLEGNPTPIENTYLAYLLSEENSPSVRDLKEKYEAEYKHLEVRVDDLYNQKKELEGVYKNIDWLNLPMKLSVCLKLRKIKKEYDCARKELKICWSMF